MARLTAEGGRQEREGAFEGGLGADHPGAEREHVHVVVLDALMGGIGVMANRRSDAADLVRRNARTDPGAADQDPALDRAITERKREAECEVRVVVVRIGTVAPEVDELVAGARRADAPEQLGLQRRAGVVRREPDTKRCHQECPGSEPDVRSTPASPPAITG